MTGAILRASRGEPDDREGNAMAGVDDIINKSKKLLDDNRDKIEQALKSEKAEDVSDKILGGTVDALKKVVPEAHHDKIDQARDAADKHVGDQ